LHSLLQYWPDAALTLISGICAWAAWSMRQVTKNLIDAMAAKLAARDEEIERKVDEQQVRLTRTELGLAEAVRDIEHLPTKADLARIEGEVKSVAREVGAVNAGVQRIEGFFLAKGVESV
jgi:hypothetical protein